MKDAGSQPAADDRLLTIDALRGLAALAVMLHHAPRADGALSFLAAIQDRGYLGVGLFLVLSGFSIHFRWAASSELGGFAHRRFWRRRVRRLYPAYLAAFALSVAVLVLWFGQPVSTSEWPLVGVPAAAVAAAASMFLPLANVVPFSHVGIAWTVALEVQLYALYTLVVRRIRAIGVWRLLAATAVATLGFRLVVLAATGDGTIEDGPYGLRMLWTWAPARMFEWMLGLAAAEAYFGRLKLPRATAGLPLALAALGGGIGIEQLSDASQMGGISIRDLLVDPVMGVAFFLALRTLIRLEPRRALTTALASLAWVGFFSYSLYLVHIPLLRAGFRELDLHSSLGTNAGLAIVMPGVIAAAYVFHRLFERPFLAQGRPPERRPVRPVPVPAEA